ncbi:hypothetical protein [Pantoea sp. 1.19]|uniref:hypothetical protein n=1 Tax=Pantoea sp. 1.19 TaxID=1925589 RepID=UPI000948916A|nr:hypothetical protein [Pantoea sp. 1.19]
MALPVLTCGYGARALAAAIWDARPEAAAAPARIRSQVDNDTSLASAAPAPDMKGNLTAVVSPVSA